MGVYINIGKADFEAIRKGEYVDKSMLIAYVNSRIGLYDKFICVTRARRFGKSMAAKMLNAYYDESVDASSLFSDLKIANDPSYEQHRNKYPVIYLDASGFTADINADKLRVVNDINDALSKDLIENYPEVSINLSDKLSVQLWKVVQFTHKPFIMIIDEWDAILREVDDDYVKRKYVEWLRTLFKDSHTNTIFAGVYMTGILPIKQYNTESTLNNFEEFSMVNPGQLAGYFGFTNDEVLELCKKHEMDMDLIQQWYDGYQLGDIKEIYNPFAVMRAVQRHSIESYWTATTTYEGLKEYITMNFEGLRDSIVSLVVGNAEQVDVMRFTNDLHSIANRDAVLTLLIHLGYLSYDSVSHTCCIPNQEVRHEFERTIQETSWSIIAKTLHHSEKLLQDTIAGNEETVAQAIEFVHQDTTSILQYNDENALAYVISLAYQSARQYYDFVRELPTGKGFADIVLIPHRHVDKPAIVIELKYNKSVGGAIGQIKTKHYTEALKNYSDNILLVGINYDKKSKMHTCKIEKISDKISDNVYDISDKISDNLRRIIAYMQNNNGIITQVEVAKMFAVSDRQARNYLKELVSVGLVEPQGANRNRTYRMKN